MAGRSKRRLWRPAAAGLCLLWAIGALAAGSAADYPARPAGAGTPVSVRVLQLNLCDSGIAGCYSGRSVEQARRLIRAERPDVITLNEVCRSDVRTLERALSDAVRNATVVSAFEPALDRRTGSAFRCRNGQRYGIAVVARVAQQHQREQRYSAVYPVQDVNDPEERVWLCLQVGDDFAACTTHLANTSSTVALAQCRYLVRTALPAVAARSGEAPMLLAGDFNLRATGSPDIQSCVDSPRADDGGVQHVVAVAGFGVRSSSSIDMHGTTDHPGLLVTLERG